jgi:hypothetical protein
MKVKIIEHEINEKDYHERTVNEFLSIGYEILSYKTEYIIGNVHINRGYSGIATIIYYVEVITNK